VLRWLVVDKVVLLDALRVGRELKRLARAEPGSLAAHVDAYVQSRAYLDLRKPTRRAYRRVCLLAVRELPRYPSTVDVEVWLRKMEHVAGVSVATRNKRLAILRSVVRQGAELLGTRRIVDEVCRVKRRRLPARRRRCPPDGAVLYLLEHVTETIAETVAVRLAAFSGLRRGELSGLRPEDLHRQREGCLLHVARTRDRFGIRPRKNAGERRLHIVELDPATAAGVKALALDPLARSSCATRRGQGGPLAGGWLLPWGTEYPQNLWTRWRRNHPTIREHFPSGDDWHALRHWGASKVAEATGSVIAVQAWLGDSTSEAATTYIDQLRGTTRGTASMVVEQLGKSKKHKGGPWSAR
jgi:integrase